MAARILIVEDDATLRIALKDNLEQAGYAVDTAATCAAAEEAARAAPPDLVLLDIMLPDGDGYAVCRGLRARGFEGAILMLTARTLEEDLVAGLDAGADDYLPKPYRLRELFARVRALLRRRVAIAPAPLEFAGFRLDPSARVLTDGKGAPVMLTRTEFDLLALLVSQRGRALSRDEILDAVWGADVVVDTHTVDNFVSSLKRKLGWTARSPFRLTAVRGVGYRFDG